MTHVELSFPVFGQSPPRDHGYSLYAAISSFLDGHLPRDVAISWIGSSSLAFGKSHLTRDTRFRIRTPIDHIGELLRISGQFLNVGGVEIGIGIPRISQLQASPSLKSHLVTIKGFTEPGPFFDAVNRQLSQLEIAGDVSIPFIENGPRKGEHRRRIIKVKGVTIVGYPLCITNLSDVDSYRLQVAGLGGRRHMGCGIFFPARKDANRP
jgi:CRISPR-associated protein Cas6